MLSSSERSWIHRFVTDMEEFVELFIFLFSSSVYGYLFKNRCKIFPKVQWMNRWLSFFLLFVIKNLSLSLYRIYHFLTLNLLKSKADFGYCTNTMLKPMLLLWEGPPINERTIAFDFSLLFVKMHTKKGLEKDQSSRSSHGVQSVACKVATSFKLKSWKALGKPCPVINYWRYSNRWR